MHRIDGPGATVDGKFTEGDPVGGIQATVVTDDWLNAVQEEIIGVLTAAGVEPVKGTQNQLALAIAKIAQGQLGSAVTTAGTASAYTLAPSPAISVYAVGQRFNVTFHAPGALNPTINVSGKGAKNLKQYDSTGAKVGAVTGLAQVSDIVYDGTDFIVLDPLPTKSKQGLRGAATNWKAVASGISANIVCTVQQVIVADASGNSVVLDNLNLTLNTAVSASATVNGMAPGVTIAINTWYAVYIWYNSTTGVSRVTGDTSFTSPTAPASGFDMWAYRGSFRTDSSTANKFPLSYTQDDWDYQWKVAVSSNVPAMIVMAAGAMGNPNDPPTWVNVGIAPYVSPVAKVIKGDLAVYNAGFGIIAPNSSYGGLNQTTSTGTPFAGAVGESTRFAVAQTFSMKLESANIYYAASGTAPRLFVIGWSE
ncbi:hypothetical protein [Pseudomonas sp. GXZC]|uniref:hypothetical protein n=1 Tax=Pseudomonas sp. GXZC TaxID=3003351 RepID=UPI0022AAACE5|nr:hypothetical protein [Pseudomonas sp. GXZC]WAT26721.1 hypothetical protein OZ428_22415 [Pseudomonas sp. GXZC]